MNKILKIDFGLNQEKELRQIKLEILNKKIKIHGNTKIKHEQINIIEKTKDVYYLGKKVFKIVYSKNMDHFSKRAISLALIKINK